MSKKNAPGNSKEPSSPMTNRSSLASRLSSSNSEVKGISRKEFKPTIPIRRKKQVNVPEPAPDSASSIPQQKFKDRLSGKFDKPGFKVPDKRGGKRAPRKEYIRATSGLFSSSTEKIDAEEHFASSRSAAELEEEKYIDPFHQSTNELTPVTLPINPRIDSKSKLLVGKSTSVDNEEKETTVSELLYRPPDDQSESTYMFTLPDVLPVDMSKLGLEGEKGDTPTKATIHNLPEGYLGRLQILKSGKARLMIGDVPLEVKLVSKSGFLQELLCCQTQSLDRGMIANIGTVPYTLSISPEYDQLVT